MTTKQFRSARSPDSAFILWGERFEETAVVTFVAELRNACLPAKVVGLTGQRATGQHGLMIQADLTLSQALETAQRIMALIVPCNATLIKRVENDPRLTLIFEQARQNHAYFVLRDQEAFQHSQLVRFNLTEEQLIFYAETNPLVSLAQELTARLTNRTAK